MAIGGGGREVAVGPAQEVIAELAALEGEPTTGERDLFLALARARAMLTSESRPGSIVAIMMGGVSGDADPTVERATALREELGDARVDIITIGAGPGGNLEALRRLARFGDAPGEVVDLESIAGLERTVYDLADTLVGSFILLYEVDLPNVGKQDCVELDLTAEIGGASLDAHFRGVVSFEGAAGDPSPCN